MPATNLAELRDSVNNTRVVLRGMQNLARAAVRLAADLEERLELYDAEIQALERQAQEAQLNGNQNTHHAREHARV